LFWQEKGIEAVLDSPNATSRLAWFYELAPRNDEVTAKVIKKYHKRLAKGKKKLVRPTGLPNAPLPDELKRAEQRFNCQYNPQGWDADQVRLANLRQEQAKIDAAEADAKAEKDAKRLVERGKWTEIGGLIDRGKKSEADLKMREYYPVFMAAHDAAVATRGMACLPAAGPTATKSEILKQYYIYRNRGDYNGWPEQHRHTYGQKSKIYKRMEGLESAYATQLVSRFGVDIMAENFDVLQSLASCSRYYEKSCAVLHTSNTTYYHLAEYHRKKAKGETPILDRTKIPLLNTQDEGRLRDYPRDDEELWKESLLGECSNQHESREMTAYVPDPALSAWKNPAKPASSCKLVYDYGFRAMTSGGGSLSDASVSWLLKYEKNKGRGCDAWPQEISTPSLSMAPAEPGETPYTLEKGFQDIARAAACTRQEQQCVKDGQYERCRMVTINTC